MENKNKVQEQCDIDGMTDIVMLGYHRKSRMIKEF